MSFPPGEYFAALFCSCWRRRMMRKLALGRRGGPAPSPPAPLAWAGAPQSEKPACLAAREAARPAPRPQAPGARQLR